MPDIELRFHHDMLVLSAPSDEMLARQGIDAARDRQYLNLMEPDALTDVFRMELVAGAQCLVTSTEDITRARLAHLNMDSDQARLAHAALDIANELKPQHVLAEIGPCGLPLDASSKASLNENRAQYADAARAFGDEGFDAFFLNGFTSIADLKCALMGVAQVSGKPVFASVTVGKPEGQDAPAEAAAPSRVDAAKATRDEDVLRGITDAYPLTPSGFAVAENAPAPPTPPSARSCLSPDDLAEAACAMADLGAAVVGFETKEPVDCAVEYARTIAGCVDLPVLAQLNVVAGASDVAKATKGLVPLDDIKEYTPDTIGPAAVKLYAAGVQFLRATGVATPVYTGAIAATVMGLDVRR